MGVLHVATCNLADWFSEIHQAHLYLWTKFLIVCKSPPYLINLVFYSGKGVN